MHSAVSVCVIGDYDGRPSHVATNEAIRHCAAYLGIKQETHWVPTESLEENILGGLNCYDAFWCAPGSPYKSAQGAMNAIEFARKSNRPFLGTCGGFQHVALEFARDILNMEEIKRKAFDPYTNSLFISELSCSLVGETRSILLTKSTQAARVYGVDNALERYNCSFGLNNRFKNEIVSHGFVIAGTDEAGEARILELPENGFFVATLFQPQLSSEPENPHKLILAFLRSAENQA